MLASILQQPLLDFERIAVMLAAAAVATGLLVTLVALARAGGAAGARWMRHRRSSLAPGESIFVARPGGHGPELFVVGEGGVRRLLPADGQEASGPLREAAETGAAVAARMLLEIQGRRPSRELAWAFVEDHFAQVPADGFVLPAAEVVAWVDDRHAAGSNTRRRPAWSVRTRLAAVVSGLRPAARQQPVEGRVHGGPERR